jgi:hypothetical protein
MEAEMHLTLQLALVSIAATLGACRGPGAAAGAPGPEPEALGFEIENQSSVSIAVYLIVDHVSQRLGTVNTNAVLAMERPWRRVGRGRHLRLRADVIGSDTRVVTDELQVQPGQVVRWILAPDLRMSSWSIY